MLSTCLELSNEAEEMKRMKIENKDLNARIETLSYEMNLLKKQNKNDYEIQKKTNQIF